tara:strand:- start:6409 stop:7041 length:633 start_codon:yes stop_codon:yes gene_type:complete
MKKILLLMFILLGCAQAPQTGPGPSKPEPMPTQGEETQGFSWANPDWDKTLVEAIESSKLIGAEPKDLSEFGVKKDPVKFWGNILVTMSFWESKWKPDAKYQESFRDRNGKRIWSRGLFQLSIESSLGYKCPFKKESDLHDPHLNIKCAVMILERWVTRDKYIANNGKKSLECLRSGSPWYCGGARYWSVLRGSRDYTSKALRAIKEVNQ